jgi:hypothetical protein
MLEAAEIGGPCRRRHPLRLYVQVPQSAAYLWVGALPRLA